jgi:hypothetical protein
MEINEHPEPVWCGHGLEWTWDGEAQHFVSPHEGVPDADAGALPEECDPIFASRASWQAYQDRGGDEMAELLS